MGWMKRKPQVRSFLGKTLILLLVSFLIPLAIAAAAVVLEDDFEPDIDGSQWAQLQGVRASTVCNDQDPDAIPRTGNSLVFWGTAENPGERYAVTKPIDARGGGTITFELRYGDEQSAENGGDEQSAENGGDEWCDSTSDTPEERLKLQYWNGTEWITINSYPSGPSQGYRGDNYALVTEQIPDGAKLENVQFRWHQGPSAAQNVGRNTAAIDNVKIDVVPLEEQTPEPTEEPTQEPTEEPTEEPTGEPTEEPTGEPTEEPTGEPTEEPTGEPTEEPTVEPTLTPTPVPVVPKVIAKLNDGSLNAYHLGRPIAIYYSNGQYTIYGIDINTGWGSLALTFTDEDIEAASAEDGPVVIATGQNPYNFRPITVYLLPTGEIQVNTMYWDGKEYIVKWDPADKDLNAVAW